MLLASPSFFAGVRQRSRSVPLGFWSGVTFGVVDAATYQYSEAGKGDDRRDQPLIDRVLHAFGERGRGLRWDGRQSESRKRNAGDVADLGAAAFVFAVDSFDVVGNRRRIGRTIVAEPAAWELVGGARRCRQT